MLCEADVQRRKELETLEERAKRLHAAINEWKSLIDETRARSFVGEDSAELENTLRIPAKGSKRSH
jgi:hypothetical protein